MKARFRIALLILLGFLSFTAIGGGVMLLAGVFTPQVEMLHGSAFESFVVPGLALAVLVGGTAAAAFVMIIRRNRWAELASLLAAVAILIFEAVEIAAIGSPKGPARNMQILYLAVGLVIAVLSIASRRAREAA